MLPIWTSEFLQAVARMDPKFIALHLQEVGGKAYEKSMQYVQDFVQRLCDCPELRLYDKIRTFLDEDFSSPEKFTVSLSRLPTELMVFPFHSC
jgi:inositol polyphosphate 5-phosphatase INPP5A